MFSIGQKDPNGRVPPGQRVTSKFPVMTAGKPNVTPAASWTLTVSVEAPDMSVSDIVCWDYPAFCALSQTELTCDIHCVTRWSKLDTRWRGVLIVDLLRAVGLAHDDRALVSDGVSPEAPPAAYVSAVCDGDYSTNLKLIDLLGDQAMIALEYDAGEGFAPLSEDHGGPARLLAPKLYLWKSAKWLRRLTFTPYERKGYWERLGYHNYGDPWKEQRYRGLSDADHRSTLDSALSRKIRETRLR
ncbi:MAG: molybdopterin-dependent oxidoreductase [Rhodobacteraceae bacterium]|nr:molybdopterin-dependent oxidoreductase [Paracoccaceae bacterium]